MKLVELVPLAIGLGCTEKNNSADDDKAQEKGKEQEKEKEKEGMDNDSDLRDKTASSTKIKQLHRLVEAMLQQDKSHKGIIFSQWTSYVPSPLSMLHPLTKKPPNHKGCWTLWSHT